MYPSLLVPFLPSPTKPLCFAAVLLCCLVGAQAQTPVVPLPGGTGAGVHSPDSPIAPLKARADAVAWEILTNVTLKATDKGLRPAFDPKQLALNQKVQRVQGFMMPLDPGEKQSHFLLTSVPLTCSFCTPGGPESMVEVKTRTPVKYTLDAVVIEGRFAVLNDDPYGLFYRLTDAAQTK